MKTHLLSLRAIAAGALLFGMAGCSKAPSMTEAPLGPTRAESGPGVLRVSLSAAGQIRTNGKSTDMESLTKELDGLAASGGTVWYYREAGVDELPPHAKEIIQSVVARRLPFRLSMQPDFSDFIVPAAH